MNNFKEFIDEFITEILYGWRDKFTPIQYAIAIITVIVVMVFGCSLG